MDICHGLTPTFPLAARLCVGPHRRQAYETARPVMGTWLHAGTGAAERTAPMHAYGAYGQVGDDAPGEGGEGF